MKKAIIYYFSGTGNTWWVSKELKKQLVLNDWEVNCFSIECIQDEDILNQITDVNHIVFGFPVYGSTAPIPMLNFIHSFPKANNNQTISIFGTQALASGDTAYFIGKHLIKKGYKLKQTIHFKMMNNLHLPRFRFYAPKNDDRVISLHRKNLPIIKQLALNITHNKKNIRGKYSLGILIGIFQRSHINKLITTASKGFSVDSSRCVNCDKCVNICPTKNIIKSKNTYVFDSNCALCLRCYSQCPTYAILIGKKSANIKKFPRYKGPQDGFNVNLLIKAKK
ncbi:ferredoxin [Natranaerovirga pectinivora]|uniref:Ferredoxin n=1 Tax=Natranaerovirga pectinivora TaxID=682400 RepID=A0A4R3MNX6_9FIRM|nr:EFR1 family ferrodoxin [Natranaerovirga pectinivora]TCT16222.1 ferredoxin [Natranaerovirga pectinivora]